MLITKHFEVRHEYGVVHYSDGVTRCEPTKTMHVFVFAAGPYRENNRLHTHHKRKHVWSMCEAGRKTLVGAKRSKQIEKFCKQVGAKLDVSITDVACCVD